MITPETFLVVVLAVPFAWSALVAWLRTTLERSETPDDRSQKLWLVLMVIPAALAPLTLMVSRFVPADVPGLMPKLPLFLPKAQAMPVTSAAANSPSAIDWLHVVAVALLILVVAVTIIRLLKLTVDYLYLHRIVKQAHPLAEAGVCVTPAAVPPLAWGRANILLPQGLVAQLGAQQLAMIISHERAHLKRGDTRLFMILASIDAVLWFNPFVRGQARLCRLAAELACDADVLSPQPEMREVYADTLVKALKHTAGNALQCAPAVFSLEQSGDYRMRITQIMQPKPNGRKTRPWLYAAMALAVVPVAFGQLAWSQSNQTDGKADAIDSVSLAIADGTVSAVAYDESAVTYSEKEVTHGMTVITVDHGDGITSSYQIFKDHAQFKVGDPIAKGQRMEAWGGAVVVTAPTCTSQMDAQGRSCQLSANNGRSTGAQSVMWGNVVMKIGHHFVHSDIAFLDQKTKTVEFHDHVHID